MSQAYSRPARENDPHALPDVEVWYVSKREAADNAKLQSVIDGEDVSPVEPGWYWWSCFPGCLPDSDPFGPFATEAEALAEAQENSDDDAE